MSLQDFLIHRSAMREREALIEAQRGKPALPMADEPKVKPGAFKVSSQMLKMMKGAGMTPDESLFPVQRKAISAIPYDKLPELVGADSMDKAQDVIAKNPRKAFNVFLRKLTKVSPKAGKMMRNVPENNSLMFYIYVTRVSGRDMADIVLKRYFATASSHPGARKSKVEHAARMRMTGSDPVFDLLSEDARVDHLTVDERTRDEQAHSVIGFEISEAQFKSMAEVEQLAERRGKLEGRVFMDVENTQPGDFGGYGGMVRSYAIYVWGNTYPIKDQLKKMGFRFDKGSGKTSRSGSGNRWVMYHRYSANPQSRGGQYRGSVSEKKIQTTIPKVKKLVDQFNRDQIAKNQRTIARVGFEPEESPESKAIDSGSHKKLVKAVDSLKRREKRLKRYGIEVKVSKPAGIGHTHLTMDMVISGNTYPIRELLKKVGFTWHQSSKSWRIGAEEYWAIQRKFENALAKLLKKIEGDRPPGEDPRAPQPGPNMKTRLKHHKAWKAEPFEDEADERYWREKMDPIERNAKRFGRHKVKAESISDFLSADPLEEKSMRGPDLRDVLKGMLFPAGDRLAMAAEDMKDWANKNLYKNRLGHQLKPEEQEASRGVAIIRRALDDFMHSDTESLFATLQDLMQRGTVSDRDQKKLYQHIFKGRGSTLDNLGTIQDALAKNGGPIVRKAMPGLYKAMMNGPLKTVYADVKKVKQAISMLWKVISSMNEAGIELRLDVIIEATEDGWGFSLADGDSDVDITDFLGEGFGGDPKMFAKAKQGAKLMKRAGTSFDDAKERLKKHYKLSDPALRSIAWMVWKIKPKYEGEELDEVGDELAEGDYFGGKPKGGMTKRKLMNAMKKAGISGKFGGSGKNWQVEVAAKDKKKLEKLLGKSGHTATQAGHGGWVFKAGSSPGPSAAMRDQLGKAAYEGSPGSDINKLFIESRGEPAKDVSKDQLFEMVLGTEPLSRTVQERDRARRMEEARFVIGAGGLQKPGGGKVSILPGREYYLGASSSPKHIIVTKVTDDRVTYRAYPYDKDHHIERWIAADLIEKGTTTALKNRGKWMDPAEKRSYEDLLKGGKGRKVKLSDYEQIIVVVGKGKGHENKDLWREAEMYGGVGGMAGPSGDFSEKAHDYRYEISMDRGTLKKLKADKKFVVISVKKR